MKDKKTIIFLLSIILCIVIVVVLAYAVIKIVTAGQKKTNKNAFVDIKISSNEKISKEDKEYINKYAVFQENKNYNLLDTDEKKNNIKVIDEILGYINQKEFDELYSLINEKYFDYKFRQSKEEYIKYITNLTADATDYTCEYYDVRNQGVFCLLTSENGGSDIPILINYISEDKTDYKIFFDGDIEELSAMDNYLTRIDEVLLTYIYSAKYTSKTSYMYELKNMSKKDITISFERVQKQYIDRGIESYTDGTISKNEITIAPNKTERIEFSFERDNNFSQNIMINFKINDKEYERLITTDYSFLEDY